MPMNFPAPRAAHCLLLWGNTLYWIRRHHDHRTIKMTASSTDNDDDVLVIRPRTGFDRVGISQIWQYRHLLRYFVLRDLRARYRPTFLGYGWILLKPVLLCLAYAAVFGLLLGVKSPGIPMVLFVFFGVAVYLFFSSALSEVANSLTSAAGIMTKVYYPRLISPLAALATNLVDLVTSLIIVLALMGFYLVLPTEKAVFFPLFFVGFVIATFAFGLILAAHSIERRDIMMFIPVAMRVLIYAMPAVYPATLIPERYLGYYYLNPLAVFLQGMRWSLMGDAPVPLWAVCVATFVVVAALIYGLVAFDRVERTMVDKL
jgi:lipopolysaccharide transport system permease protein